jgi:uncharacterized cofD-like protein
MKIINKRNPKIVVIGGGTGSFTLLQSLKKYTKNITAVVNMADDGGSTGTLRDELGVLPPGDVRQCLVALSPESSKVRELFNYRFEEGGLQGHAFGNLFLTALEKMSGGTFVDAVETASAVLNITGKVVPATLDNVRLRMSWPHKQLILKGERIIDTEDFRYDPRTATLSLMPSAKANPAALAAIRQADLVVLAPGDLYTSLGPILVASGFRKALQDTLSTVVYVCNLVTKKGQTDGFDAVAHADEIERFVGAPVIDVLLYNTDKPPIDLLEKYASKGELWVEAPPKSFLTKHYEAIGGKFLASTVVPKANEKGDKLAEHRSFIRHDSNKVARALFRLSESNSHTRIGAMLRRLAITK